MAYIYLASPYTHPDTFTRTDRYRAALRATALLMEAGEIVFCPVAYGHSLETKLKRNFPVDYWLQWSRSMLAGASRLYVLTLPGWEDSIGVGIEVRLAHSLAIPVSGFAPFPNTEDVSGIDILGNFGLSLPRRPPVFNLPPDKQED